MPVTYITFVCGVMHITQQKFGIVGLAFHKFLPLSVTIKCYPLGLLCYCDFGMNLVEVVVGLVGA